MRNEYDFSGAKRARDVPHLAQLQSDLSGKTRISIRVDNQTLAAFKLKASATGANYQTLMNKALDEFLRGMTLTDVVRETIRAELKGA